MKKFQYKQINLYQYYGRWEAELVTDTWKMLLTFGHKTKADAYKEAKEQVNYLNNKQ